MFGWEYPPKFIGGLGKVTYELCDALAKKGIDITLVLPIRGSSNKITIIPTNISVIGVKTLLNPYLTKKTNYLFTTKENELYSGNLYDEVEKYTKKCIEIIKDVDFDIIHCHDWMTFKAGVLAKKYSNKKLILHVHSTEYDRSIGSCNPYVYSIEMEGFKNADKIIAVSEYTKRKLVEVYNINKNKINVVHNAVIFDGNIRKRISNSKNKIVLFLGRLSLQKGPDYFIKSAKRVLEYYKDVIFVLAGDGELLPNLINLSCELGIETKMLFTGRLSDEEVHELYSIADLYVMPSVSEPFGLTALEAASKGVPIIISKNSGVREILRHALEVDFWDIEELTNKIICALNYLPLKECIIENTYQTLPDISWDKQADKLINIYNNLL